jgi:hypothetical protein
LLDLSRASLDCSLLFLAILSFVTAVLTARIVPAPHHINRPASDEPLELVAAITAALAIPAILSARLIDLVPVLALVLTVAAG